MLSPRRSAKPPQPDQSAQHGEHDDGPNQAPHSPREQCHQPRPGPAIPDSEDEDRSPDEPEKIARCVGKPHGQKAILPGARQRLDPVVRQQRGQRDHGRLRQPVSDISGDRCSKAGYSQEDEQRPNEARESASQAGPPIARPARANSPARVQPQKWPRRPSTDPASWETRTERAADGRARNIRRTRGP